MEGEGSFLKLNVHSDIQIWWSPVLTLLFNTKGQAQRAELDVKSQKPLGGLHFSRE